MDIKIYKRRFHSGECLYCGYNTEWHQKTDSTKERIMVEEKTIPILINSIKNELTKNYPEYKCIYFHFNLNEFKNLIQIYFHDDEFKCYKIEVLTQKEINLFWPECCNVFKEFFSI